jgi:ABC-2 type transport system permease protein
MPDDPARAPVEAAGEHGTVKSASFLHLLRPRLQSTRNRARTVGRQSAWHWSLLAAVGVLFWGFGTVMLVRVLGYFERTPEIGVLLAGKLLGLIFLSFFAILLLSNIITALSSFFLARDLDMCACAPVDWLTLYGARLSETLIHSSWMVVLMGVPIMAAYGFVYKGGLLWPLVALVTMIPYFVIPAVLGTAFTLLLVHLFPARRTRDLLSVVAVLSAAGLVLLLRLMRPERLVRPEGMRSLMDFIALLRMPTSPYLPSEWAQNGLMGYLTGDLSALPFYLLWTTAAALVVLGAGLHRMLYAAAFSKAQEGARSLAKRGFLARAGVALFTPFGVLRRELILKEVRMFFRDPTQWSQLILLAVLVVVYVFNVRFLPSAATDGVSFFLVNVIPFLNLGLAGFVLASIAARFIFPAVSMEGRTLWLLRSSPLPMRQLLWSKYWTGTLPLLVLALSIVGVTDALLGVSEFIFALSIFTITFMTLALAALALGLGAVYPRFEAESAAQIPTSFGGLVYMLASALFIGAIVLIEARPVHTYLSARALGTPRDPTAMAVSFGIALLLSLAVTFVPLEVAVRRMEAAGE